MPLSVLGFDLQYYADFFIAAMVNLCFMILLRKSLLKDEPLFGTRSGLRVIAAFAGVFIASATFFFMLSWLRNLGGRMGILIIIYFAPIFAISFIVNTILLFIITKKGESAFKYAASGATGWIALAGIYLGSSILSNWIIPLGKPQTVDLEINARIFLSKAIVDIFLFALFCSVGFYFLPRETRATTNANLVKGIGYFLSIVGIVLIATSYFPIVL